MIPDTVTRRNARELAAVRWYLLIYPYGRKHLPVGLEREKKRREDAGETPIDYFAPLYVEAREADGRIVTTNKPLFENYVFVRASITELFRLKEHEERYNLPRRQTKDNGEFSYPYITDEAIRQLRWVARSNAGKIPVYVDDTSWLIPGDRIRIITGPLKGIEATLFSHRRTGKSAPMMVLDKWITIPLLHLSEHQYMVVGLNTQPGPREARISDEHFEPLHQALLRHIAHEPLPGDEPLARRICQELSRTDVRTDVMRCKAYALLIIVHTLLQQAPEREQLLQRVHALLPAITAQQSKALLLVALYGATDDSQYHLQAHQIIDPWTHDPASKPAKKALIQRLKDYDAALGHGGK